MIQGGSEDAAVQQKAAASSYAFSPQQYCMLRGKLFSANPAVLGYVVCTSVSLYIAVEQSIAE